MPITSSAKKAHRASLRKQVFNTRRKRALKDSVKAVTKHVQDGKLKEATAKLGDAYKAIDKAVKRGVLKKNTGDRKKSQLARLIGRNETSKKDDK